MNPVPSRRRLLQWSAAAAVAGFAPPALAALPKRRDIKLFNLHNEEMFNGTYWADGRYVSGALKAIRTVLRDHRDNSQHAIDPKLLDLVVLLRDQLGTREPVHVICGYRSPRTNAMLVRTSTGVASNSYHMRGMAIDLRVPGRPLRLVRQAALHLGLGGVGYYPHSDFVHVDVGPPRHW